MPTKRRFFHRLDWSIYRDEIERSLHHRAEHPAIAELHREPDQTGIKTIDRMIARLCDQRESVRLEAIKTLGQANEVAVIEALVKKTQDCDLAVRWAAMNVLIRLGRKGVRPLLEALTQDFNSACLRQSARRILQTLYEHGDLTMLEVEVLRALETRTPAPQVASVANHALIASFYR
jgi:HEAT repeat protein